MNIPAVPYMKVVQQFAEAHGLKFFTWKQKKAVIELYNATAENLN